MCCVLYSGNELNYSVWTYSSTVALRTHLGMFLYKEYFWRILVYTMYFWGFFLSLSRMFYTNLEMSRLPMKHYKLRPKLGAKKEHSDACNTFRDTWHSFMMSSSRILCIYPWSPSVLHWNYSLTTCLYDLCLCPPGLEHTTVRKRGDVCEMSLSYVQFRIVHWGIWGWIKIKSRNFGGKYLVA